MSQSRVIQSPSGRFELEIQGVTTEKGFNHSLDIVRRVSHGEEVVRIERNYGSFHHGFVTKNDEEYLIAGRSYMGQTIINLDQGVEYNDEKWPDGYEGWEFCWARPVALSPDGDLLCVAGCHWAAPYEFRVYDFSDPSKGLPEIQWDRHEKDKDLFEYPSIDDRDPVWIGNDVIETYKSDEAPDDQDDDDETPGPLLARCRFKRQGDKMMLVEGWISDVEKERRRVRAEVMDKYEARVAAAKKSEIYQLIVQSCKDSEFTLDGVGWSFPLSKTNPSFDPYIEDGEKDLHGGSLTYNIDDDTPLRVVNRFTPDKDEPLGEFPRTPDGVNKALILIRSRIYEQLMRKED